MNLNKFTAHLTKKIKLSKIDTGETGKFKSKEEAIALLEENIAKMALLQDKLYAQDRYSLLIVLQAMDTAGKDGIIKHVMRGLNPQGTHVHSFKQPSAVELDHDYLWRANCNLPERGQIGIFNRSYYEEVLVVKVHNLITKQQLPDKFIDKKIWQRRYRQIADYERYLTENGTRIIKIFLHISKDEQKKRLLERIDDPAKNWKFSAADISERQFWEKYQQCYEKAFQNTSTDDAPWYIVPADKKWYSRFVVSEIIVNALEQLELKYPEVNEEQLDILANCKQKLEME